MILGYPLSWLPLMLVVGVIVVLNAYLALLAVAVVLLVAVAVIVCVIALVARELVAYGGRMAPSIGGSRRAASAAEKRKLGGSATR